MRKTEWRGPECPPTYIRLKNAGMWQLTIFVDVHKEKVDADLSDYEDKYEWVATQITLPVGVIDYGSIVSAIIDSHYSADQMQAIVNNYLIDTHMEEFTAMQEYREYAKQTAHSIVDEINTEK